MCCGMLLASELKKIGTEAKKSCELQQFNSDEQSFASGVLKLCGNGSEKKVKALPPSSDVEHARTVFVQETRTFGQFSNFPHDFE
mmetsp:Transcript_35128/g.67746  ORF Transcript_35128/g.67746 Transcript_35128/m.67746 type:complete len:85 (+) Transcript_35128:1574-1828(+)